MRRFSAFFSSAAFGKLNDPATTVAPSMMMILLRAMACCPHLFQNGCTKVRIGRETTIQTSIDDELLAALRAAREQDEIRIAGRREKFWRGLVNRWDNSLDFARNVV